MRKIRMKIAEPIIPCPACHGSGSDWPRRKDGGRDRRYFFPRGPCSRCHGRRTL